MPSLLHLFDEQMLLPWNCCYTTEHRDNMEGSTSAYLPSLRSPGASSGGTEFCLWESIGETSWDPNNQEKAEKEVACDTNSRSVQPDTTKSRSVRLGIAAQYVLCHFSQSDGHYSRHYLFGQSFSHGMQKIFGVKSSAWWSSGLKRARFATRLWWVRSPVQSWTWKWLELCECIFLCFHVPVASRRHIGRHGQARPEALTLLDWSLSASSRTSNKSDLVRSVVMSAAPLQQFQVWKQGEFKRK